MARLRIWHEKVRPRIKQLRRYLTGEYPRINRDILRTGVTAIYLPRAKHAGCNFQYPGSKSHATTDRVRSCLCTEAQLTSDAFRYWIARTGASFRMHRKLWEHGYIMQSLYERNLLRPGMRGLGFAVGEEPLPKIFAEYGCDIVATDLDETDERSQAWRNTGQHMSALMTSGRTRTQSGGSVVYRNVDMNKIPQDLDNFDFTWSTCSFEHCGSLRLGQEFIWNQMRCLKPGGVAIHTTEFNLSSNDATIEQGSTVIFRRQDIEVIIENLVQHGHEVEPLTLDPGNGQLDRHIDEAPYSGDRHLRLALDKYAATSIGLIIRKSTANTHALSA